MPNAPVPAAATGLPASRRGFLRGLTSLPLIGGGVALIGQPTAVAEPVTARLLMEYETWLACEVREISRELRPDFRAGSLMAVDTRAFEWHEARHELLPPSTRAALVLATVGCDWRRGGR